MKSFCILAAIFLLSATLAVAQVPIVPTGLDTIPAAEADQHLIERIPPRYPQIAKVAKVEGEVQLLLEVDANGAVVRIVDATGPPLLLAAARDAARRYRYNPFERNGKTGEVLVPADIEFKLPIPLEHPVLFPPAVDVKAFSMDYNGGNIKIRVAGDGTVDFNGIQYVAVEGKHRRKIEPEEVQPLVDAFRKADFFSREDDYSVAARTSTANRFRCRSATSTKQSSTT
jgi:TonB family protein